jgi:hypothetical protein
MMQDLSAAIPKKQIFRVSGGFSSKKSTSGKFHVVHIQPLSPLQLLQEKKELLDKM